MELRREDVFWGAFTDELEKIAAGKPPNLAQLMKIKAKPTQLVPVRTQAAVLPPPPSATMVTGPQAPFVASPAKSLPSTLTMGQTNVPPTSILPGQGLSGIKPQ